MNAEETLKAISQLMCGKDTFPGDIVQYIKNEIDGRKQAEQQLENLPQSKDLMVNCSATLQNKCLVLKIALPHIGEWSEKGLRILIPAEYSKLLSSSIAQLDFSVRVRTVFRKNGIHTIWDLITKTESDLLGLRNLGHISLREVKNTLAQYGLTLQEEK